MCVLWHMNMYVDVCFPELNISFYINPPDSSEEVSRILLDSSNRLQE